jgi:hypothetical protein
MSGESINTIDCTLNDFFSLSKREGLGSCKLTTNTAAFISIWNKYNESFRHKFLSLEGCFKRNGKIIPEDLNQDNTIWIETLKNGGAKGVGKKFLDIFKIKALEHGYKYVFLYPSASLGGLAGDQDRLIGYYEDIGFKKMELCDFWGYNDTFTGMINKGPINDTDYGAPYHLMFAEISELNTTNSAFDSYVINYREKYLKYKAKYLELKKSTK